MTINNNELNKHMAVLNNSIEMMSEQSWKKVNFTVKNFVTMFVSVLFICYFFA